MRIYLFFIPLFLVFLNFYILYSSQKKINGYKNSPPFFVTDFTESFKINRNSKIKFLADGDLNTFWIKEREVNGFDFEIELRLTHYFKNGFQRQKFQFLKIVSCENANGHIQRPEKLQIQIFLKEAINVDKELRLPREKIIKVINTDFRNTSERNIRISNELIISDTDKFPENIFIIGVRGKISGIHPRSCIAEISLTDAKELQ